MKRNGEGRAKCMLVIEAVITRGKGTTEDPKRVVIQYCSLDGQILAENDPIGEIEEKP